MNKRTAVISLLILFIFSASMYFATHAQTQYQVTFDQTGVGSDFLGTVVTVDSVSYGVSSLPVSFWYDSDSSHSFAFQSPLIVGASSEQYVWTSTTGLSSSQSESITVTTDGSIIGNYKTQYYLVVSSVFGTPGGQGWYDSGSTAYATITPLTVAGGSGTQYVFTQWGGDASGNTSPSNAMVMSGPMTATANWKTQYYLTVSSAYGSVGGQGWYDSGSTAYATLSPLTVAGPSGTQYAFDHWGGDATGNTSPSDAITVSGPKTATAGWKTQYYLTVSSAYGATGGQDWYDSGATAYASVSPLTVAGPSGTQYVFTVWSGDASGSTSPSDAITMNSPKTASAGWKTQYYLTVSSAYGATGGQGWYDSGATAYATVSPLTVAGASGTQYVFTVWSGDATGSTSPSNPITMNGPKTATAGWKTEYYLTVSSARDSPTPVSGWFDFGSSITESVTSPVSGPSGTQYVCTGWTGTGNVPASGGSSLVTFTITTPSSITWNWKTQYQVIFDQTGVGSDFLGTVVTVDSVSYGVSSLPVSFWYDSGSSHSFSFASPLAVGSKQYVWGSTSGLSLLQSETLTVTASGSVVGNYQIQNQVTFDKVGVSSDFTGTVVIIDSVSYSRSQLPVSFSWSVGSIHSFAFQSPLVVGSTTEQYVWTSTTGLSSAQSGSITITTYGSIIGHYKTQYYLTVSSPHDSPSPVSGWLDSGSSITESVTSPGSGGSGIQYVCTGWTGTGSVPASGTASSITFTAAAPSSITWDWKTQYYLSVSSPYDSPSPISGWFDSGSSVTESVTSPTPGPSGTHYVVSGWTGTGNVPSSGLGRTVTFTMAQPSSIAWNWKTQYYLTVSSPYDSPTPLSGWFDSGSSITESVTSPVSGGSGTQYVCTGWTGTGSVPSSGSSSSVTFTITGASSITWNWQVVQRALTVSSVHDSPNPHNGLHYINDGMSVTCSVSSPVAESGIVWTCTGWTGTGSVPSSGTDSSVTFTISRDSTITWNWHGKAVQHTLTVFSAHDNPSPAIGNHLYDDGDSVTCSVTSPVTEFGVAYVCTGWTGTGSVPSSGSGSSVTFTISEDSSITWNWQIVLWNLTVSSAHGSPSPAVGDHLYNASASVTCSVSGPVVEAGVSYTCTGWVGTGSVPSSGSGVSVTFSITQSSSITWSWVVTPPVQWNLGVVSAHGSPSPAVGDHFYDDGSSVTCNIVSPVVEAGVSYTCTGWVGTGSVPSIGSDTSTTFTITENSTITWNWVVTPPVLWNLTVSSAHDSPSPGVGDNPYGDGSSVTCSVTSPVTEAGQVWTCTGWVGSGSVPSMGSDTSTTFTITENSSITWSWVVTSPVRWNLAVTSAHGSPNLGVGDHLYDDGSSVVCSVSSPVVEAGVSYTCTGWSGSGSVPSSGSGSSVAFTIAENSTITWGWQVRERPTIGSCDGTGAQKDVFNSDETVYVSGTGYATSQTYNIYVVNDTAWVDGMTIPARIQGTVTSVSSDSSGNINLTVVWNKSLTPGKYDIMVDVNGNGKYDADVDALYNNKIVTTAGFSLMPEYLFGTILGLAGCFAALGAFRMYKRKRR
jgi:hypothetical protein